jgi:hypothetical protein
MEGSEDNLDTIGMDRFDFSSPMMGSSDELGNSSLSIDVWFDCS